MKKNIRTSSSQKSNTKPKVAALGALGLGIRRRRGDRTLDVWFPVLSLDVSAEPFKSLADIASLNGVAVLNTKNQKQILVILKRLAKSKIAGAAVHLALQTVTALAASQAKSKSAYSTTDLIVLHLSSLDQAITSCEEAYFKLHVLSSRLKKPHEVNLNGLFATLPNVAWTNHGPVLPEDVDVERLKHMVSAEPLDVSHVDKFPYLTNYIVPAGVRIADASCARLGAHLAPGTTVMPSGFVNFNAGTLGAAMIEGRVSAGVVVEADADVGGGASIMGTLSGGGKEVIRVGRKSLIGANAGIGISLGKGCTVAAGLYVTAGAKVSLYDSQNRPVNLQNHVVAEGQNVVKAKEVSGRDNLLFYSDSQTGKIVCKPNRSENELNQILHA